MHAPDEPPPPPDYVTVDVNLKGAINTVHLARHYLARSPEKGSVVITASCSSFWPAYRVPIYTASKCTFQREPDRERYIYIYMH